MKTSLLMFSGRGLAGLGMWLTSAPTKPLWSRKSRELPSSAAATISGAGILIEILTWSHFSNLHVPAQIALSRKVQGPRFFRGEPEWSEDISMNRWWSFLSCLTSLYDQPLPFAPLTKILCRGSLGEMDQGRDYNKRTKNQGLQTVCRPVALIYVQLQGKNILSVFHKLVPLNAPHRRPGSQTWWKSFIFLAPMGEI